MSNIVEFYNNQLPACYVSKRNDEKMKPLKMAVIGAGDRGSLYAQIAQQYKNEIEVVAVAEPIQARRDQFVQQHKVAHVFHSWEEMFQVDIDVDVVFVTTQDRQHFHPVMAALDRGFHVVVEKPLSPSYEECVQMIEKAKQSDRLLMLCYVLCYTPFFQTIKSLLKQKEIGDVKHISIDMDVAYWHFAHSFVRGNWRNEAEAAPMVLAKSCHDLDILSFLLEKKPLQISSYGKLSYFTKEHAPQGATFRCTDGCKVEEDCPFSARKIYMTDHIGWPVSTISDDLSIEGRMNALKHGPYGRCVFHCDNDVVDHQVVNLFYNGNITASITMSGFTSKLTRKVRVLGTNGEINGDFNANELTVTSFGKQQKQIELSTITDRHGGGDAGLMEALLQLMKNYQIVDQEHYYNDLLMSHFLAFQAEQSRKTNQTIVF